MGPSRSHALKESRETSNRKYHSKTILACRERQAKKSSKKFAWEVVKKMLAKICLVGPNQKIVD